MTLADWLELPLMQHRLLKYYVSSFILDRKRQLPGYLIISFSYEAGTIMVKRMKTFYWKISKVEGIFLSGKA